MPQPSDFEQFFGAQHLSDQLSSIVDGLDEYYHCRRTDCGCIATNSTWPSTVASGGGKYWRPDPKLNCMRKYRAYPQMYAKGLAYQYCEWGSALDENDIHGEERRSHVVVRGRVSHSAESQAMPCCATRLRS